MGELISKRDVIKMLIALEGELLQFAPFEGFEAAMYRKVCWLKNEIEKIPAAGAGDVVRCKDCKGMKRQEINGISTYGKCLVLDVFPRPDDFCSYGERRDDGDDHRTESRD